MLLFKFLPNLVCVFNGGMEPYLIVRSLEVLPSDKVGVASHLEFRAIQHLAYV
jgi:hypothetical protein